MSLIKKIVDIVDKNEGVDARKNIIKLKKEVTSYKDKIKHYIDRNYVEFLPDIVNNEMYLEEGINLQDKIQDLSENAINEGKSIVYSAHDEMSKHIDELNEIQMGLEIALKLMKIDAFLQQINMFNESESYTEVNDILTSIDLILKDPANQIIRKMDMYPNLKIRLDNEYQNMLLNLKRNLDKHIQLNEKTFPTNKSITISLSKNKEALKQTVETLSDANFSFQKISDFLLGNVFEPTFAKPVSLDFVDTEKDYVVLSMSFSTKPTPENLKPTYGTVFSNLKRLIHFLKDMNVLINGQVHFLPLIFGKCEKNFVELLINQCIVYAIPNTIEERKNSTLKDDILKLHKSFVDNKFLESSDSDKLRDFVQQIDDLFQNRFSKNVLDQSALIVKKDLHDMILAPEGVISTGAAAFPRCMISKSTLEIINLLGKVLNQAKNATDNSMADSLYEAVETTLKNYPFTIQQYHSKFLSKIPQQSAVFYNNCMYLAHWLSFSDQIVVKGIEAVTTSLTKQGTDIFEHQVEKQKILLLDVLKEFGKISFFFSSTFSNPLHLFRSIGNIDKFISRILQACSTKSSPNGFAQECLANNFTK